MARGHIPWAIALPLFGRFDDAAHQVHGEVADPEDRPFALHVELMPKGRTHSGQKLIHPERLRDVIIGTQIERLHFAGFIAATGKHNYWNALIARSDCPQKLMSLYIRQAEIENDQIGASRISSSAALPLLASTML